MKRIIVATALLLVMMSCGGKKETAQQEEFVLYHCDTIEASGFVEHLKLPHYVDFQGELELIRTIRREQEERRAKAAATREGVEA